MSFNKLIDEVVCVVTPNGDIIGKMVTESKSFVTLKDPRAFVQAPEGVGFAPSVSLGCEHKLAEVCLNMSLILTVTKAHPEVAKAWRQQTSGLVTP